MTRYLVYDVFTDRAFGGNPLAVIPDATGLDDAMLGRIAAEFNLSETTFVYPPEDPAHDARVRIFTPASELPFAGHPTIGTALALHDLGRCGDRLVMELGIGPIPVEISGGRARFETRVPLETRPAMPADRLAEMLSLPPRAVVDRAHPPVNAGVGLDFLCAELADADALSTSQPDLVALREEAAAGRSSTGILAYVRRGQSIDARMFAPLAGVAEDPATGSAAAALAALLGRIDGRSQSFAITQGVDMGRPSSIQAAVTVEDGRPVAVTVAGGAVRVMEGRLSI
jgi:trans-2,3-dihydro-3-hydroxyanthranilate isomerase